MDQTGKRVVGEVLGPLNQGQVITLDCLVNGGELGIYHQGELEGGRNGFSTQKFQI